MLKHKGLYVVLGIAGALVALLGTVGVAYAQGPQPPVDNRSFRNNDTYGYASPMGGGWMGMRGYSLVDATAEATGLTVDEVIAELQAGQTFAQIATEQGVDPQAIVDAFVAERKATLDEAVADGRLTQEQVDQMLAEMTEHLSEQLDQTWTPGSFSNGGMGQGNAGSGVQQGTGFASRGGQRGSGYAGQQPGSASCTSAAQ